MFNPPAMPHSVAGSNYTATIMKAEKTISICGQDVQMLYCAATETGFEQLANRSINVFLPDDADENPAATGDDYIKLGIAAIIAAYARNDPEPPVSVKDVLYEATPQEVVALITSAVEPVPWYDVPGIVEEDKKGKRGHRKNA